MTGLSGDVGTSASTPFWASLITQINAVFADQKLPRLGYMTDLLYIAASIAPASFNDETLGNNVSSFFLGGPITDQKTSPNGDVTKTAITPTGYGYYAGPGYDSTTGLGSPDGLLLARTLDAIAHVQTYFGNQPNIVNSDAWTSRLAEQSLQPDFDPRLVLLFDKNAQGNLAQGQISAGQGLSVSLDGNQAHATQGSLTSAFGFADFMNGSGVERLARPIAIAETANGENDATVVARLRQDGEDNSTLTFYRVDDFSGTVAGLRPGDPGYAGAAQGRAYQLSTGGTSIAGPGYGNFAQTELLHVNAGDLVAMTLTNNTHGSTFFAFAQANEQVNGQAVGHLWNYGANTWGWEDTFGGGDRDYNDMVVGLDFTSASGRNLLV
jgi:hypothetical protein